MCRGKRQLRGEDLAKPGAGACACLPNQDNWNMDYTAFPAWPDVAARLIAVAAGREPADCVIRGGVWVNVHSRECLPGHDIAIAEQSTLIQHSDLPEERLQDLLSVRHC